MANAAVGDIFLMTFQGMWHNQTILTTFHYQISEIVAGPPTVGAMADQLYANISAVNNLKDTFLKCCPPQYSLQQTWIQKILPTRILKNTYGPSAPGTNTATSTTANLQCSVIRRGEAATRHGLGAIRVPFPNLLATASNGGIPPEYAAFLTAVKDEMIDPQAGPLGTFSPVLIPSRNPTIIQAVPILYGEVKNTIRTQRTRTVGHGI